MKKITVLFSCLLTFAYAFCQQVPDTITTDLATVNDSLLVVRNTYIFIDSNKTVTLDNLLEQQFTPVNALAERRDIPARLVPKKTYLLYSLKNTGTDTAAFYIFPGQLFTSINTYEIQGQTLKELPSGNNAQRGYTLVKLPPGKQARFIQELEFCKNPKNYISPQLIHSNYLSTYEKVKYNEEMPMRTVGYLLSGLLLMMTFFMAANFLLNYKKEFLYNFIYCVCMFGLMFLYPLLIRTVGGFYVFYISYLDFVLMVVGTVFYIAFTRRFLDTKTHYPTLEKIFRFQEWILLALLAVFTYIHFFTDLFWLENTLENLMKVLALLLGIVYIVIAFRQKNRLMNYIAAGNAVLIFFSVLSLIFIWYKGPKSGIFTTAYFHFCVGIVGEIIFFMLGLIYKNRKELVAKTRQGEALKLDAEKKEFESKLSVIKAQQEERNRISADMHDDLGSGMTAIRLYSELAKKKINISQVPEIEKISSSANELLNKMNAIIWTMSSSNDTLGNLISYIRSYALEYFENTGVDCRFTMPEQIAQTEVAGEKRRNVYLTVKETLNNILKHSGATAVHIEFWLEDKTLLLLIHDNGKGIDLDNLREFGNGLKNMKKRMENSGCNFNIENNKGTLVTLKCSL